ncbi:hypothetical protein GE061_001628 [Apolygus lucorum]|uniref:Uncharacterized protein n=1 Tax=Apolygus lucorum TaxID=248454 RepID=A0A6A4K2C3_APOLU|nr:hypothetical protein GE061_001628 [Apolygus lucorum]
MEFFSFRPPWCPIMNLNKSVFGTLFFPFPACRIQEFLACQQLVWLLKGTSVGSKFSHPRRGPLAVLTEDEEKLLVKWLEECRRKGFPKRQLDLLKNVEEFLKLDKDRKTPSSNGKPGKSWMKGFLSRHPEITYRTPKAVTAASSNVSSNDLKKWFQIVEDHLEEEGCSEVLSHPERIFNGDETNFLLCPKTGRVLINPERSVTLADHAEKERKTSDGENALCRLKQTVELYYEKSEKEKREEAAKDERGKIREQNKATKDNKRKPKAPQEPIPGTSHNPKLSEPTTKMSQIQKTSRDNGGNLCFECEGIAKTGESIKCKFCEKVFHKKCSHPGETFDDDDFFICSPCLEQYPI